MIEFEDKVCNKLAIFKSNNQLNGLIHNDLHRKNILVNQDYISIIDFGMSCQGCHLWDLAFFLTDIFIRYTNYEFNYIALLKGYSEVRPEFKAYENDLKYFTAKCMIENIFSLPDNSILVKKSYNETRIIHELNFCNNYLMTLNF